MFWNIGSVAWGGVQHGPKTPVEAPSAPPKEDTTTCVPVLPVPNIKTEEQTDTCHHIVININEPVSIVIERYGTQETTLQEIIIEVSDPSDETVSY